MKNGFHGKHSLYSLILQDAKSGRKQDSIPMNKEQESDGEVILHLGHLSRGGNKTAAK
jgi:hypothetical protein